MYGPIFEPDFEGENLKKDVLWVPDGVELLITSHDEDG
jgi:hypothetical protein